jgi:hypothetical protein
MRQFELDWGQARLEVLRDPVSFSILAFVRTIQRAWFFLGAFAVLLLVGIPRAVKSGWIAFASLAVIIVWILSLFTTAYPHYIAPATGLIFVVAIASTRRLLRPIDRIGPLYPGTLLVHLVAVLELVLFGMSLFSPQYLTTRASPVKLAFADSRAAVIELLEAAPGYDIVLIRYGPGHSYHREWTYNRADIDGSAIIWARDMGNADNQDFLARYPDRLVWKLVALGPEPTSAETSRERVILESVGTYPPERHQF